MKNLLLWPMERMMDQCMRMMERMMDRCMPMMERMMNHCMRMMERMPEDAPPKVMTSGIRHLQEQNEELLALLREQNELLRERAPVGKSSSDAQTK